MQAESVRTREPVGRRPDLDGRQLLEFMIRQAFPGRIALVSSFGAESVVLLYMVSEIDRATPVIFLDTGKLFAETLHYRDRLVARLGLEDVRSVTPDPAALGELDPGGDLWRRDPDRCCYSRKVAPLRSALEGFDAWITGRKRYQGELRAELPLIEAFEGRVKVNPLAAWPKAGIDAYIDDHGLPRHPLEASGFPSVGCMPCSHRVAPAEGLRAGRWTGTPKTECGIHLARDPGAAKAAEARSPGMG